MAFVNNSEKINDLAYSFFTFLNYFPKAEFQALVDEYSPAPTNLTDVLVDLLLLEGVQFVSRD